MDLIDKIITDIGNDMKTLSKMNSVLFGNWQDVKSEQFNQQYTSLLDEYWRQYFRDTSQRSSTLQAMERQLADMASELRKDEVNAQRMDVSF
jgi:hypothetical protein